MAGEITVGNLVGNIDINQILQMMQVIKSQQILYYQSQQSDISNKKSAINQLGSLVNDFKNTFNALTDPTIFNNKNVSVSNQNVISAVVTDNSKLNLTNIDLTVNQLAKNAVWLSNSGVSDVNAPITTLGNGTLTINYANGTKSININYDNTKSLNDIANAITSASNGEIIGSIVYDGSKYRLMVTSKDTGVNNDITGMVDSLSDSSSLAAAISGIYQKQQAQDAQITLYGNTITSSNNTFNNLIPGLSITALSTGSSNISVSNDYSSLKQTISNLVDKYNKIVDFISTNTGKDGVLSGEYSLNSITTQIFNGLQPLLTEGILNFDYHTGHLSVDNTKLDAEISTNLSTLQSNISQVKNNLFNYMVYITGIDGIIQQKSVSYDNQINSINETIQSLQDRLNSEMDNLKQQFIYMQNIMQQYQSLGTTISATFLNKNNNG